MVRPDGTYPYWPRDKDGYPTRQGSLHQKRTADGRTVLVDTTARTDHRRPIHVIAPRLVRPAPTGGVEDVTAATLDGQTVCICRTIKIGEQVEW